MGLTPAYRVVANGSDITQVIDDRLVEMRLTDEAGMESDLLEIELADHLDPIALPPTGAELELFLGYDGAAERMGLFVVDEVEVAGWPSVLVIRARASVQTASKGGKVNLQTQKTRSWPAGTTLGALASKIASEHGLTAVVSASLRGIALPHTDQTRESDLHLLTRLAKRYDALIKPADGKLVVTKRGEGKTASGQDLPAVEVVPSDCTAYRCTIARRDSPGLVRALYHSTGAAKREAVEFGKGEPVRELRQIYPTKAAAADAARAEYQRRQRGESTLSVTLPGRPSLIAECRLTLTGFRPGVDGDWITTRASHSLTPDGGWSCTIEAEKPTA